MWVLNTELMASVSIVTVPGSRRQGPEEQRTQRSGGLNRR